MSDRRTIATLFGDVIEAADAKAPRPAPAPPAAAAEQLRQRILADLRAAGATGRTVPDVAAIFGISRAIAWGHLEALYRAELAKRAGVRGPAGKPAVVFVATRREG